MADPAFNVLCVSGLDPSGGAGIQADIEAVAAGGGHALSLITALTVQDTRDVRAVQATDLALLQAQARAVAGDCTIHAIKVGVLVTPAQAEWLAGFAANALVPLVLDPVLRAAGGSSLVDDVMIEALREHLVREATVLTPNFTEARRLCPGAETRDACADALLSLGARSVLITGGDEDGEDVLNTWHRAGEAVREFRWPRIDGGPFHGSGCTLASAIAVRLARGLEVGEALADAQRWCHQTLERALAVGGGQPIPGRWHG